MALMPSIRLLYDSKIHLSWVLGDAFASCCNTGLQIAVESPDSWIIMTQADTE